MSSRSKAEGGTRSPGADGRRAGTTQIGERLAALKACLDRAAARDAHSRHARDRLGRGGCA
ncbi:hypothetical protein GCM10008171_27150 [Methylopila jiangsuensis]|uniref:Uncharacterized protein n=1 Tax=Methylopila jiangsuensis TaxID=586230 RepID=A0A9W6JH06_9HYPH|nr:hypothetical protein GCM10008171_27150 [Methylopila jiangsuensis]